MAKLLALMGFIAVFLAACDGDVESPTMTQRWNEMEIHVETRPSPPSPGMAEIVVMVTEAGGKPVHDLIVSLRTADADPWIQAIQDGHLGAYRRAAKIGIGERSLLQIKIKRGQDENVLRFPLQLAD